MKLEKKIEFSGKLYGVNLGIGSTSKNEIEKFINKYLFNSNYFECLMKSINDLKKDNAFETLDKINEEFDEAKKCTYYINNEMNVYLI